MEELDILFLNLHRRYINSEPEHGGFLGIYLLAAFVNQEGYSSKSYSGTLKKGKQHLDKFCQAGAVSMIGLYCDFENVTENIFLSNYIKENYKLPVIVGGPQSTALDENFFTKSKCDVVVRYEGELTVLELMNYFLEGVGELSKILGISYMIGDKLRINPERPLIKNLDALPFIDESCYIEPKHFYRGLSIMTGRGCPFHCAFCHEGTHARSVRFHSVESVLAEIDEYLKVWRGKDLYIFFTDDTFTLNVDRVRRICKGLAERRKQQNFRWFCEGHVHTLYNNPEMINYMVEGGCERIQLGIEAGTEEILRAYDKHSTPEEIIEVVRRCRDVGIAQVYGNIILAGAHFNQKVYEADREFIRKLLLEGQGTVEIGVVTFWPLPETPMTSRPEEFGIKIVDSEFLTSVGDFSQVETEQLDRMTIIEMQSGLEEEIKTQMIEMLHNGQVPTKRIISWLMNYRKRYGQNTWTMTLSQDEILFAYYEMIALGEGIESSRLENILTAHPMRVVPLYRHLRKIDETEVEICGERFIDIEVEIITLTTGKLSVEEIAERTGCDVEFVMNVLNRLERKHLIVYSLY